NRFGNTSRGEDFILERHRARHPVSHPRDGLPDVRIGGPVPLQELYYPHPLRRPVVPDKADARKGFETVSQPFRSPAKVVTGIGVPQPESAHRRRVWRGQEVSRKRARIISCRTDLLVRPEPPVDDTVLAHISPPAPRAWLDAGL